MPYPKLLHPLNIEIQPLDVGNTIYDQVAREEIQIVGRQNSIIIPAQMEFRDSANDAIGDSKYTPAGLTPTEKGYALILTRTRSIIAPTWEPRIGDRIARLGVGSETEISLNVYVSRTKQSMHYPRYGYCGLKLFFSDRKPSHG